MTLGAGSIGTVGDQVLEAIRRRSGSVAEEDR
jgi:hypothetical protein